MITKFLLGKVLNERAVGLLYGPATRTTLADRLFSPWLSTPAENPVVAAAALIIVFILIAAVGQGFVLFGLAFGPWTVGLVTLGLIIRGGRGLARMITFPASSAGVQKSLEREIASRLRKKLEESLDGGVTASTKVLLIAAMEKRRWWQAQQTSFAQHQMHAQHLHPSSNTAGSAAPPVNPFTLTTEETETLFTAVRNLERARKNLSSFTRVWEKDDCNSSPHASVVSYYARLLQAVLEAAEASLFPRRYYAGNSYAQAIAASSLTNASPASSVSLSLDPGLTPAVISSLSAALTNAHVMDVSASEVTGAGGAALPLISARLADEAERTVRLALGLNPVKPAHEGSAGGALAAEATARLAQLNRKAAAAAAAAAGAGSNPSPPGRAAGASSSGTDGPITVTVSDQHHLSKSLQTPRTAELLLIASSLARRLRRLTAWVEMVPTLKVRQTLMMQVPRTALVKAAAPSSSGSSAAALMTGVAKVAHLSPAEVLWHAKRTNRQLQQAQQAQAANASNASPAAGAPATVSNPAFAASSSSSPDEISLQLVPASSNIPTASVIVRSSATAAAAGGNAGTGAVMRAIPLFANAGRPPAYADPPHLLLRLDVALLTASSNATAAINTIYRGTGLGGGAPAGQPVASTFLPVLPLLGLEMGVVRADLVLPPKPVVTAGVASQGAGSSSAASGLMGRLGAAFGLVPVSTLGGAPLTSAAGTSSTAAPARSPPAKLQPPCNCGHSHGDEEDEDDNNDAGGSECGDSDASDTDDASKEGVTGTAVGVGPDGAAASASPAHRHHHHHGRRRFRVTQEEEEAPYREQGGDSMLSPSSTTAVAGAANAGAAASSQSSSSGGGILKAVLGGLDKGFKMAQQMAGNAEATLWAQAMPEPICGLSFIRREMMLDTDAAQLFFKGASPYEVGLQQLAAAYDANQEAAAALGVSIGVRPSSSLALRFQLLWTWCVTVGPAQYLWRLFFHTPYFLIKWTVGLFYAAFLAVRWLVVPRLPHWWRSLKQKCGRQSANWPVASSTAPVSDVAAAAPASAPAAPSKSLDLATLSPYKGFLLLHPQKAMSLRGYGLPSVVPKGVLGTSGGNDSCVLETLYVPSRARLERLLREGKLKPLNGGSFDALLAAAGHASSGGASSHRLRFRLVYRGGAAGADASLPLIGGSCFQSATGSVEGFPSVAINSTSTAAQSLDSNVFCITEDPEAGTPGEPSSGSSATRRRRKTSPSLSSLSSVNNSQDRAASSTSASASSSRGSTSASTSGFPSIAENDKPSATAGDTSVPTTNPAATSSTTGSNSASAAAGAAAIQDWGGSSVSQAAASNGDTVASPSASSRRGSRPRRLGACCSTGNNTSSRSLPARAYCAVKGFLFDSKAHGEVLRGIRSKENEQAAGCPVIDLEDVIQTPARSSAGDGVVTVELDFAEVAATAPAVAIFCGPNAGLAELVHRCSEIIPLYTQASADILILNYRGYGRSTGTPSPSRLQADAASIARFLKNSLGVKRIIAHGESIGGVTACALAALSTQPPPAKASLFSSSVMAWIKAQQNLSSPSSQPPLADAVIGDRTLDTLSKTAEEMVAPIAAFGLSLVTRWVSSNAAALLRAPSIAPPRSHDGRQTASSSAAPVRSPDTMQTTLLMSPTSSSSANAAASAADPYSQLVATNASLPPGVQNNNELRSLDDLQGSSLPAQGYASSSAAITRCTPQGTGSAVLKLILWDPQDEVIHWKGSLAVGMGEALCHSVVATGSVPRPLKLFASFRPGAHALSPLAADLRSISARLFYICVLWKRAAVRGMGSWSGANYVQANGDGSPRSISLNAMPAFVGAALSGFPAGTGLSASGSSASSSGSMRNLLTGTAMPSQQQDASPSSRPRYVFEPAARSERANADIRRLERLPSSCLADINRSTLPLLWQAAVAEAKGCLFPLPIPPSEVASSLGRDTLPFPAAPTLVGKKSSAAVSQFAAPDSDDDAKTPSSTVLLHAPFGLLSAVEPEGGETCQSSSFALSVAARFATAREHLVGKHLSSTASGAGPSTPSTPSLADTNGRKGVSLDNGDQEEDEDVASVLLRAVESAAGRSSSIAHAAHTAADSLHATAALSANGSPAARASDAQSYSSSYLGNSTVDRSSLLATDTSAWASLPYCISLALKGNTTGAAVSALDARLSGANGIAAQQFQQQQQHRTLAASCAQVTDMAVRERLRYAGKRYRTGMLECLQDIATMQVTDSYYGGSPASVAVTPASSASSSPLELPIETGVDAMALACLMALAALNNGCGLPISESLTKGWKGSDPSSATGSGISAFLSSGAVWGWPLQRGDGGSVRHLNKSLTNAGRVNSAATSTSTGPVADPSSGLFSAGPGWRLGRTHAYLLRAQEDSLSTCLRRLRTLQTIARQQRGGQGELDTLHRFYSALPPAPANAVAPTTVSSAQEPCLLAGPAWVRNQLLCETIATLEEALQWSHKVHDAVRLSEGTNGPVAAMGSPQGLVLPLTCGHNIPWGPQERRLVELGLGTILEELQTRA